ncbi:diguanylate cyclase domain-containing protein [Sulfuricurvum sp.]|uniref:diguanylate cyclase domain-containing protein n=1 Tax=Sulfuricurvum sp. TaxID=2025608 RepID=UPI003563E0C0
MSLSSDVLFITEDNVCSKLFQAAIDTQKNLIILLHNNIPILFNKAFQDFTNLPTVREFLREFGSLPNRFVPHDAYFHAGKAENPDEWITALAALPEQDRIVSMINFRADPFAFSVSLDRVEEYTIVSFTDISQDLIKRIMIENDVSIDKESGAYNKDYFIHTAKSFHDAAEFNEKEIGITLIEMMSSDADADKYLHDFSSSIKCNIRQSDMLVRWGKKIFLLAYLIDTPDNAMKFSRKLLSVMREEPFEDLNTISMRIGTTVQKNKEDTASIITRAENALKESLSSEVTLL